MAFMPDRPPAGPLDIDVTVHGDRARLSVAGQIDITNAEHVQRRAQRCLDDPRIARLVADLARLTFLDSSGLRGLVRIRRYAQGLGKLFHVENYSRHIALIMDATGLTGYLADPTPGPG